MSDVQRSALGPHPVVGPSQSWAETRRNEEGMRALVGQAVHGGAPPGGISWWPSRGQTNKTTMDSKMGLCHRITTGPHHSEADHLRKETRLVKWGCHDMTLCGTASYQSRWLMGKPRPGLAPAVTVLHRGFPTLKNFPEKDRSSDASKLLVTAVVDSNRGQS